MTKDEFVQIFEENKKYPFIIETSKGWSVPLKFIRVLSDSVQVTSNGVPSFYQFSEIKNLSYDITDNTTLFSKEKDPATESTAPFDDKGQNWEAEYMSAKEHLYYHIEPMDRIKELRAELKSSDIYKEWNRIMNIFVSAQKNHSLEQKVDNIIFQLDSLQDCTEVRITYGIIYEALKEYENASEEFHQGGDYYNAACCAKLCGNDELALNNLICLIKNEKIDNIDIFASLFYLLTKFKSGADCVIAFSDVDVSALTDASVEVIYYGLLSLLKCYDPYFSTIKYLEGSRLDIITSLLREISDCSSHETTMAIELTTLSKLNDNKGDSTSDKGNLIETDAHELFYEGHIYNFDVTENNAYGFISSHIEKNLYFNIRQVEDQELRNLLWNGILQKAAVTFTLGTGASGKKSGDHVKLKEPVTDLLEIKEGMITSYGDYDLNGNRYGIIQCDGKDYLFRDNAVIDPVLTAYFSNAFSVKSVYVKFIGRKYEKNRIVLKLWFDANEEQKLIEEYKSYAEKLAYDVFLRDVYNLEHGSMSSCPFTYEALPLWEDESTAVLDAKSVYNLAIVSDKKPKDERGYSSKPATSSFSRFGISELLKKGTFYLTKEKNLGEAEAYFKEVLSRHPEQDDVNTAVSNLVTIYKQDDRFEDAHNILQQYEKYLDCDKYHNQLVDILDKTKQYDQMIKLLKEMIPTAGKAKPHRIKQLIICYIKTQNARDALRTLKAYKQHIDDLTYNTLYIQALDIQGNFAESERFLIDLISKTYRIDHKLNYISRLAVMYQKNDNAGQAISMYEQWKKTFSSNRSSISTSTTLASITKFEITVDQNLCVLYYQSGRKEEAKQIAQILIRKNSEDIVARQILDGTYVSESETITMLPEAGNDYPLYEDADNTIPKLLEQMLNKVEFENLFFKKSILENFDLEKRRYIGNENQAYEDITETLNDISRPQSNYQLSVQSEIYMALAKIAKQFVDSGQKNINITQRLLNALLGKSLMLHADADVKKKYQNRESSRYYYFLALRYLSRCGDKYRNAFYHTFNLLYFSFFQSDNELAEKVESPDMEKLHITPPDYEDSVLNPKDLMICTFDLYLNYRKSLVGEEIIRPMIDAIYCNNHLCAAFLDCLKMFLPESHEKCHNSDQFFEIWKKAKDLYSKKTSDLKQLLQNAPRNIKEPEKLKDIIKCIKDLKSDCLLCKTDRAYLEKILEIIEKFVKLNGLKETLNKSSNSFQNVV